MFFHIFKFAEVWFLTSVENHLCKVKDCSPGLGCQDYCKHSRMMKLDLSLDIYEQLYELLDHRSAHDCIPEMENCLHMARIPPAKEPLLQGGLYLQL